MYNSISGIYTGRSDGVLFLLNNGIEWMISAPESTIQKAALYEGDIRIFTYLYHREDTMAIYGFYSEKERRVFLELIKVSGIGPKQALRMLSGISAEDLVVALDDGNTDRLSMLPGIGRKTAAKIILSLRGKLKLDQEEEGNVPFSDIIEALAGMGFDRKMAKKAVGEISGREALSSLEKEYLEKEIFREAIVLLSSGS